MDINKTFKVAMLGDSATQFLAIALRGIALESKIKIEILEAGYNQTEFSILNFESDYYKFSPDYTIILMSSPVWHDKFSKNAIEDKDQFSNQELEQIKLYVETINNKIQTNIIISNIQYEFDFIFGNYSSKTNASSIYQTTNFNIGLMKLSQAFKNVFISDIASLRGLYGQQIVFDPRLYASTKSDFSYEFLPYVAKNFMDIILSISGTFKKCLILDLDNTLWGGIIGDDGLENIQIGDIGIGAIYSSIQLWAKNLKERGIILAICSKNNESTAKEPFLKHPDMILRLEDISVFVANWGTKSENINYIHNVLNIGFDSMVFLDDNPFERELVKSLVPEITVPELPSEPSQYLPYLRSLNLFEVSSFSTEDKNRTIKYQEEASRQKIKQSFNNASDFLKDLNMKSKINKFDNFNSPRISQLTQRSNQFNLRTVRYNESDITNIINSDIYTGITFSLTDRFGEYGIVALVILESQNEGKNLFIDTWIMSCRVLKRTLETFVTNELILFAKNNKAEKLIGEYIPTPKNIIVKDHYKNLGFREQDNNWILDIKEYKQRKCFINQNKD